MAVRKPLVCIAGKLRQWVSGDKLPVEVLPVGTAAGTVCAGDDSRIPISGIFTPTQVGTNVNVSSVTFSTSQYLKTPITVHFSTLITVTPTVAGVASVRFSLPVASNLTSFVHCIGNATSTAVQGYVSGDTALDCAVLSFNAPSTSAISVYVTCTYRIN